MKQYTQEELHTILKNHKHWLKQDCVGWQTMKADLSDTNLSGTNLIGVNLRNANLSGADLSGADLIAADLRGAQLYDTFLINADLRGADLRKAHLSGADLSGDNLIEADLRGAQLYDTFLINADLRGANLRGAILSDDVDLSNAILTNADLSGAALIGVDLSYANLSNANLRGTDLSGAYLVNADLRDVDLSDADLSDAELSKAILIGVNLRVARNIPFIPQTCPEEGSFIGYKKVRRHIVKLEILADARRCSATGRLCRCDKAKILGIQNLNIDEPCELTEIASSYEYRVGEIVEEPEFDEDRWNEYAKGIHFFINRQEAVRYQ